MAEIKSLEEKSPTEEPNSKVELKTLEEFLVSSAPGSEETILVSSTTYISGGRRKEGMVQLSSIRLHCESKECGGLRNFSPNPLSIYPESTVSNKLFLSFICNNCKKTIKTYSIDIVLKNTKKGVILKYGEHPPFGEPTKPKLLRMLNKDKDEFLKGRRAENQGMGIAAFAYYRRIVENMKDTLFDEIIDVAKMNKIDEEKINEIESAKLSFQFSNAFKDTKMIIPDSLLLDSHNPLTVLHKALSDGLHAKADEECLEIAHNIRVVLSDFAERLDDMKKNRNELKGAISKLMSKTK